MLPQRAQECQSTMLRSRLHRRTLARSYLARSYGYANASLADTIPHRHSSVRYFFLLNGAAISWRASRTILIVVDAAKAELYSQFSATQEAIYLRKVCIELGFLQNSPTIMYEDCQAAVILSKENRFRNRSKQCPFAGALLSNDKVSPSMT